MTHEDAIKELAQLAETTRRVLTNMRTLPAPNMPDWHSRIVAQERQASALEHAIDCVKLAQHPGYAIEMVGAG